MTQTITRRFEKDFRQQILTSVWHARSNPRSLSTLPTTGPILAVESSKAAARAMSTAILAARQMVCVCSFLLADRDIVEALLHQAQSGVPVYLLVASETRLAKSTAEDSEESKAQVDAHRELLRRLAGWVLIRTADHFHAKFVLVDPRAESPDGFLSTANLTDEALRRNPELVVRLPATEVRAAYRLFVWAFWEHAQRELSDLGGSLKSIEPQRRFTLPGREGALAATAGSRRDLRDAVLAVVRAAKHELWIASFSFGHPQITSAIRERCQAGVKVTILARESRPAQEPQLRELASAGATVLGIPWIHAKALCADDDLGLITTANLTAESLEEDGFELGILLDRHASPGQATVSTLRTILQSWATAASYQYHPKIALGQLTGRLLLHGNPRQVEQATVTEHQRIDLGELRPRCCTEIATLAAPSPQPLPKGQLAQVVEYVYRVVPPVLDTKAVLLTVDDLYPKPKKKANAKVAERKSPSSTTPAPVSAETGEPSAADGQPAAEEPTAKPMPPFDLYREPSGRRVLVIDRLDQVAAAEPLLATWQAGAIVIRT